uniref:Uncharacterized protein n=1 Tax=Glossina brevipalpis TaxID=37001 RepID=A0A1A9WIC4_9MUSC
MRHVEEITFSGNQLHANRNNNNLEAILMDNICKGINLQFFLGESLKQNLKEKVRKGFSTRYKVT